MTRKDYELIARSLRSTKPDELSTTVEQVLWRRTCRVFAGDLQADNPNFNCKLFLRACGIEGD